MKACTLLRLTLLVLLSVHAAGTVLPCAAQQPTTERMRWLIRWAARREPPVDLVVRAALAAMRAHPDRARRLASRARMSGWVPALRLGMRRGQGWDLSALSSGDSDRTNLSTDDELMLSASMTFRLDRLVFSPEEVPILREERALESARAELIGAVIHLFFERRRLILERELLGGTDLTRTIRISEATALLDGFTDGAFRRMMAPNRRQGTR